MANPNAPTRIDRVRGQSDDPNVRGLSGSIWAALSPSQRATARALMHDGMEAELMEEIMAEILRRKDQQIAVIPHAKHPNPLQRP